MLIEVWINLRLNMYSHSFLFIYIYIYIYIYLWFSLLFKKIEDIVILKFELLLFHTKHNLIKF